MTRLRTLAIVTSWLALAMPPVGSARTTRDLNDVRNSLACLIASPLGLVDKRHGALMFARATGPSGERHLWMFMHRRGESYDAFNVEVRSRPALAYRIVNNARLSWDGKSIAMINPPLGGLWTQAEMTKNFHKATRAGLVKVKANSARPRAFSCTYFGS